jgi:hypothetical protein
MTGNALADFHGRFLSLAADATQAGLHLTTVLAKAAAVWETAVTNADATESAAKATALATALSKAGAQKLLTDATAELVCAAQIENAVAASGEAFVKATDAYVGALVSTATAAAGTISGAVTSIVASWRVTQGTHYADYVAAVISAGLKRFQGDLASDLAQAAAEAHADAVLSAAESSADARAARQIAGAGLAWATIVGPAWSAAAAAEALAAADANGALADASQAWAQAIGSAFVGWGMAQAQADADFGIAGAIAGATAGNAAAAAGSAFSAAASKAAGDLTRALNAVQTGFVDAATAASLKATKTIAAAETVERKAVAKADVVLAKDLQAAWGTYAATERSAVTANARERATIGADYKKDVAGAELAAVKEVAPVRKTSMVDAAEANGAYEVKVTAIVADMQILAGTIHVTAVKAKITDNKVTGYGAISAWFASNAEKSKERGGVLGALGHIVNGTLVGPAIGVDYLLSPLIGPLGDDSVTWREWTDEDNQAMAYAESVYSEEGGGFHEIHVPYASQFGDGDFQANLYRSKDGTYYLAFRGTEGPNLADWRCNAEQGLGGRAGQYEQAARLAASVGMALAPNQRLILTGHSLGGGLASYAALHNGLEAIVFNPASVHSSVADNARAKIRSHLVFGDPLSLGRTLTNPFQWTVPQDLISRATLGPILSLRCPRGDVILHDFKGWLIIDGHGFGSFPGVR